MISCVLECVFFVFYSWSHRMCILSRRVISYIGLHQMLKHFHICEKAGNVTGGIFGIHFCAKAYDI